MHSLLHLCICLCLLGLVIAEDDPKYAPLENFRPKNVTGLSELYTWVGSYYNATTEIKLTPISMTLPDDPVCDNLKNTTQTAKWNSIVAITERGLYNNDSNPVNLMLNLVPPHYNWSTLPWQGSMYDRSNLQLPFRSAEPQWIRAGKVDDLVSMNISQNSSAGFDLSGFVPEWKGWGSESTRTFKHFMPACNITEQTGEWRAYLQMGKWWNTRGWSGFRYPTMNLSFDEHTVNLTVSGLFQASPYLRTNATAYQYPATLGNGIMGKMEIHVHGVLDPYHSDILDVKSSTPTWLRTVGFGNNSLNIDNDAKSAATRSSVALGSVSITLLSVLFGMILSA